MVSRLDRVETMLIEEDFSILFFARSFESTSDWLIRKGLILVNPTCPKCEIKEMQHIQDLSRADKLKLRCKDKKCGATKTFRWRTLFENQKLTLVEAVQIVFHYFIRNTPINEVISKLPAEKVAVSKMYSKVRSLVSDYVEGLKVGRKLGMDPVNDVFKRGVVEIDESLITHHNGEQMWILGIFDRATKELFCFALPDRTSNTLIPIIKNFVDPSCRVYTDGWASYSSLKQEGYDHRVVLHVDGFGSGYHTTNGIESCWSEIKRLTNSSKGIQLSSSNPLTCL